MNVFGFVITPFVTLALLGASQAHAQWTYPVDPPTPPTIIQVRQLVNPTVQQIQDAIDTKTRIDVIGTVDASSGGVITVNKDDVRLNFKRAKQIIWSGNDRWDGFIQIGASRVDIVKLRMKVAEGSGRCRGVMLYDPTDVRIRNCVFENVSDGMVADGSWNRISIENTQFLGCTDWANGSMDGGYGFFLEDDDDAPDNLRLANVKVTLASDAGQHGLRISKVQNILIENCDIGANQKRSMWAYGVENLAVRNTTFRTGSVMINLKPFEIMTDQPSKHIRMSNCRIFHSSIMVPLQIYCGKGTVDFKFCDMTITSSTSNWGLSIEWRSEDDSHGIRWFDGSLTFNGQPISGMEHCYVSNAWSDAEREQLVIGPIPDPRNN